MWQNIVVKKVTDTEVELTGEVPSEYMESYRARALKNLASSLELPGFRRGHVPNQILEERMGAGVLEEMARMALGDVYPKIIAEHKLDAIDRPRISITKFAVGNPMGFKISQTVLPEIKLPDYKALAKGIVESDKDKRRAAIVEAIMKEASVPLPTIIVERELENMVTDIKTRYGSRESDVELRAHLRPITEARVRVGLLIETIARAENIEPVKVLDFLETLS